MNNIVLVKPNLNSTYSKEIQNLRATEPPLWLLILANVYKTNIILDAEVENYTTQQTLDKIIFYKPSRIILMASGNHPSAFIQSKEEINNIAICLNAIKRVLPDFSSIEIEVLNKLPVSPIKWNPPRWDLIDLNKYRSHNWHAMTNNQITSPYGVIYTSISCPFFCNFCVSKSYYSEAFEERPVEDIIADFKVMKDRNVKNIKIMDELFIFNPNRVELICDEIIKLDYEFNIWAYARIDIMNEKLLRKMREAGIRWLAYGIESGSEKIRKDALKGNFTNKKIIEVIKLTQDSDICVIGNFMFGFEEDNYDTLNETLNLALELNCEYVNFYCVSAFPNTPLYEELKTKGYDLPSKWSEYSQVSEEFKPLATKYLTGKQVLNFRDKAFNQFFTSPDYLSMIQKKFGEKIINEIKNMTNKTIKRIYG